MIDAVGLIVVVPVCAALIVVTALQWSLIDSLTPFGYYPLLLGLWALWFLVGIGALVTYLVRRPRRLGSALPMLVCVATFFVLVFVPVTAIQAKIDFRAHRVEREALVARVLSGELAVDDGLVALGPQEPRLSRGGNEVAVEKVGSGSYVLFFAVRGVLDNYSGYLWVPSGGDPRSFWDLSESESCEIKRYDDHWYWVAHW
ncbi:MAG: hypothetical protein M5U22_06295 [Thermoleophilia bacterium]|nr:hypothetical protein [Thermoleophilia bacterium]